MKSRRIATVLCLVVAAAAIGLAVWMSLEDAGTARPRVAELDNGYAARNESNTPLDMPEESPGPKPEPQPQAGPAKPSPAVAMAEPELHVPDYGPAIQRGGAKVEIELYDANGARWGVGGHRAELWRAVGDCWVEEDAIVDPFANVVRCVGLGLKGLAPTGLEPGTYEIVLTSEEHGSARHRFQVTRGETLTERVTLPVWRRPVCFTFVNEAGAPVSCIPWLPKVITSSKPLEGVDMPWIPGMEFKRPPTEPDEPIKSSIGSGGGGSGWIEARRKSKDPVRYPTDQGRFWVTVTAGCENTVSFHLEEAIWGQQSYSVTDDFTITDAVTVTLKTAPDFEQRVLDPGHIVADFTPGNAGILDAAPIPLWDPLTEPVGAGRTRLVVRVSGPADTTLDCTKLGYGLGPTVAFQRAGNLHWHEFDNAATWPVRFLCGGATSASEDIDVSAGGIVVVDRVAPFRELRLLDHGLSPTLDAFAFSREVSVAGAEPVSLRFQRDPAGWFCHVADHWPDLGMERKAATTLRMIGTDRYVEHGEHYRTTVTDTGTYYKYSRSYYSSPRPTPAPTRLETKTAESVTTLQSALEIAPKFENLLVLRTVDSSGAGMPGVEALIIEYEHDAVASAVRDACNAATERPVITRADAAAYTKALEARPTGVALRMLMGDAYDVFATDEQRHWFARHGAWYHTRLPVESDKHGYVAKQLSGLEPGKCYVLYLWGGSRDDHRPDARIVFKAADVTDLGAITLPAYTD